MTTWRSWSPTAIRSDICTDGGFGTVATGDGRIVMAHGRSDAGLTHLVINIDAATGRSTLARIRELYPTAWVGLSPDRPDDARVVAIWNDPPRTPIDIPAERRRLRAIGVDGTIDLRRG
jgi:hypothetical protein